MAQAGKLASIGGIVHLRQMLRRWRARAHSHSSLSDVPAGHLAVCVGSNHKRYVVKTSYLNHPVFVKLLSHAEEEYGFSSRSGPLVIPCDECVFENIIRHIKSKTWSPERVVCLEDFQRGVNLCLVRQPFHDFHPYGKLAMAPQV